jgi:uncharacterized membrane protein YgcG
VNAPTWKLLGRMILAYVNRLADIGVCCCCFLPKQLLEHAPVGDMMGTGGGSRSRGARTSSIKKTAPAVFTGSGAKLGSSGGGGGLAGSVGPK